MLFFQRLCVYGVLLHAFRLFKIPAPAIGIYVVKKLIQHQRGISAAGGGGRQQPQPVAIVPLPYDGGIFRRVSCHPRIPVAVCQADGARLAGYGYIKRIQPMARSLSHHAFQHAGKDIGVCLAHYSPAVLPVFIHRQAVPVGYLLYQRWGIVCTA